MGIKSTTRDKREFRHFAQLASDGSVPTTIQLADGSLLVEDFDHGKPIDAADNVYVEVTDIWPHDFTNVRVPPQAVANRNIAVLHASLKAQNKGRGKDNDRGGQ